MTFKEWKAQALEYLHNHRLSYSDELDWILGDDEDMKRDGFNEGETPEGYVDYQIECGQ